MTGVLIDCDSTKQAFLKVASQLESNGLLKKLEIYKPDHDELGNPDLLHSYYLKNAIKKRFSSLVSIKCMGVGYVWRSGQQV